MDIILNQILLTSSDFPSVKPFIISLWYGSGKPDPVNDYLFPFVCELKRLIRSGIVIDGYHVMIKIRCFLCDTPARSLLKG